MDKFRCDYECRTVGESLIKYNIPDDWCAEFGACDKAHPMVCVPVDQIRSASAMMNLKLRLVENKDSEYAGCMLFAEHKAIVFKIDYMSDLVKAMNTMQTE